MFFLKKNIYDICICHVFKNKNSFPNQSRKCFFEKKTCMSFGLYMFATETATRRETETVHFALHGGMVPRSLIPGPFQASVPWPFQGILQYRCQGTLVPGRGYSSPSWGTPVSGRGTPVMGYPQPGQDSVTLSPSTQPGQDSAPPPQKEQQNE